MKSLNLFLPVCTGSFLAACNTTMQIPDSQSIAAQNYRSQCALCHSLPHPKRHKAEQWPALLNLMEQHRLARGMEAMDAKTRTQILEYLQEYAL